MTESEIFDIIDFSIDNFKRNEGFRKGMKVSKKQNTGWLIFNWRQITWVESNIDYLIEIYPEFDKEEKISSWTLYTAACYDQNNKRFYLKYSFAKEKDLNFIVENISSLLVKSFNYITAISREEIPFIVDLK